MSPKNVLPSQTAVWYNDNGQNSLTPQVPKYQTPNIHQPRRLQKIIEHTHGTSETDLIDILVCSICPRTCFSLFKPHRNHKTPESLAPNPASSFPLKLVPVSLCVLLNFPCVTTHSLTCVFKIRVGGIIYEFRLNSNLIA